jgi:hypothetical protein
MSRAAYSHAANNALPALQTPAPQQHHYRNRDGQPQNDPASFFCGNSPGAGRPPRGKQMLPKEHDLDALAPRVSRDAVVSEEAAKLEAQRCAFDRMGASDPAHRGKRMFGEGAHRANAYLFVEYGSFPPPVPRPYGHVRDTSEEALAPYVHKGNELAREAEVEKIAATASAFDRNFSNQQLHGFFKIRETPTAMLSERRAQRGLLDGITDKSCDATPGRTGKRMVLHDDGVLTDDANPIPGLKGVGVGQTERFDMIHSTPKRDTMPPMQPHFGTHHDARYGVHGFTTCPPAPPTRERAGWFNWTEDRQKCPVTDAGFDPLLLKAEFCSPGDPLNHPQRLRRIDLGTPQASLLLRNDAAAQDQRKPQCVKMFHEERPPEDSLLVGFKGFGDANREAVNARPRGMRKLEPHHEQPRRAKSSLDYYTQ